MGGGGAGGGVEVEEVKARHPLIRLLVCVPAFSSLCVCLQISLYRAIEIAEDVLW